MSVDNRTTIHRTRSETEPMFSVGRGMAQDRTLSLEARAILLYLLSKPSDWTVQINDLRQGIGRDKVYKILKELIVHRYIRRTINRDSKRHVESVHYEVFGYPLPENQDTGNQDTENQDNIQNTEIVQDREYTKDSMRESLSLSRGVTAEDGNTGEVSGEQAHEQRLQPTSQEFGTSQYTQAHPTSSKVPLKVSPPGPSQPPGSNGQTPKREKPALPPTYGDLFVAIRAEVYGAGAASGKQLSLRAGQDAKTLLADFPDATAAEFMDFVKEYHQRQPGITLPRNGNLAVWFDTYRREWKPKVDEWIVIPHPDPAKAALGIMKEIRRSEVGL